MADRTRDTWSIEQSLCEHLNLIVQRDHGVRWVTCTDCLGEFLPEWIVAELDAEVERLRELPTLPMEDARMAETHRNAWSSTDEIEHELTMDCVCGPDVEWFDPETGVAYESPLVIHHSLDGRELVEEPSDG